MRIFCSKEVSDNTVIRAWKEKLMSKRARGRPMKSQRIKVPLPERFHKYFYLITVCQSMYAMNPIDIIANIIAFIGENRELECMEDGDKRILRQYLLQWGLIDFTRCQKEEQDAPV